MDEPMRQELAKLDKEAANILDNSPRGISMIVGPTGEPISDVMRENEGIVLDSDEEQVEALKKWWNENAILGMKIETVKGVLNVAVQTVRSMKQPWNWRIQGMEHASSL